DPPGTWSHAASPAVRALTAIVDHTIVVGPAYDCDRGASGTIDLGLIDAAQTVSFKLTNQSHDLGRADSLTDLGIPSVTLSGTDTVLASVTETPTSPLHEGDSTHIAVKVKPGATGSHAVVVFVTTDEGAVPGAVGLVHPYTIVWSSAQPDPVFERVAAT